jgi:4-amino-4-deoxy-L-arabinose transferase-like glycosyltransferase
MSEPARAVDTSGVTLPASLPRGLRPALWILLVGFSFLGVFDHSLWGPNDSREAGMIAEMRRDHVYVATVLDHELILEKPPLAQWTALLFCEVAGRVTEGLVRLPSAVFGLGTLILLYLLLRSAGEAGPEGSTGPAGERDATRAELGAWSAVLLCAGAAEFWEYARVVLTDMTLAFMVMLSLFLFWRAWQRGERDPGATAWRWAPFLLIAAAAFYAKGLIGPGFVWCAVGSFLVWKRRFRLLAGLGLVFAFVLVAVVAPWAGALYRVGGHEALHVAFWDNQFGRFLNFNDASLPHDPYFVHKERIYYYLKKLPVFLMPWSLLLVPAFVAWWRRATPFRAPVHVFVRAVLFGMLLLLHVAAAKVGSYALPVFPFFFAMAGVWLADAAARPRLTRLESWCGGITVAIAGVALCGAPLALIAGYFLRPGLIRVGAGAHGGRLLAVSAAALLIAAASTVAFLRARRGPARAWVLPLAPGLALLAFAVIWVAAVPVIEAQRTYAPIIELTRQQMATGPMPALYRGDQRWLAALEFYLDRTVPFVPYLGLAEYLASPEPRAVIVPLGEDLSVEKVPPGEPVVVLTPTVPGEKGNSFVIWLNAAAAASRSR